VEIKKLNPKILWSARRGVKTIFHRRKQRKTEKIEQKEAKETKVRKNGAERDGFIKRWTPASRLASLSKVKSIQRRALASILPGDDLDAYS
jgi:hypothetical protein